MISVLAKNISLLWQQSLENKLSNTAETANTKHETNVALWRFEVVTELYKDTVHGATLSRLGNKVANMPGSLNCFKWDMSILHSRVGTI